MEIDGSQLILTKEEVLHRGTDTDLRPTEMGRERDIPHIFYYKASNPTKESEDSTWGNMSNLPWGPLTTTQNRTGLNKEQKRPQTISSDKKVSWGQEKEKRKASEHDVNKEARLGM